jgi:histidinol phosphatase-like PHP family hydrolase
VARFDYVFTDAMTFTDQNGKRVRLWINSEVDVPDPEAFMEMHVAKIVGVISQEPIDIYVNPTFLPEVIAKDYDRLWTKARMERVIDVAAAGGVAIEINARYRLPSPAFIRLAKAKGVKFAFGTNNIDRDLGRLEYCREMIRECHLTAGDMFVPKPDGQKPVQLRGFKR